jgi:hypothetical protein
MSVQVSYKKQTVLGIALLLIIFLVIEIIGNVWWVSQIQCEFEENEIFKNMNENKKQEMCEELYNVRTSGIELIPNQNSEFLNINSHGFRGGEITLEKPNDTYRIFMVGGSTMFGMGATSDEKTIPGFTQTLMDKLELDYDIEVINAGIQNANTQTEITLIEQKIIKFNPDLIIMYDGWNDIREKFDADITLKNWNTVCELGVKNNFEVIVSLQPIAGFGNKILTNQESTYATTGLDYENNILLENISNYDTLSKQMSTLNICSKSIDMRSAFDENIDPIYWDQGHISDKGNSIISKLFFNEIIKIVDNEKINETNILEKNFEIKNKENDLDFGQNIRNVLSYYKTPLMIKSLFQININSIDEKIYSKEIFLESKSKVYDNMQISIQVKIIPIEKDLDNKIIEIKTIDENTGKYLENMTYFIKISKDKKDILREYFFSQDQSLSIKIIPKQNKEMNVEGYRNYEHNALNDDFDENIPIIISGPLFNLDGEYNFSIDILTIEDPKKWIFSLTDFNTKFSLNKNSNENNIKNLNDNLEKIIDEQKNIVSNYDSIKFINIVENDEIFDNDLKQNAVEWKSGKIIDEQFIANTKTHSEFNELNNMNIQKDLPEWLLNNPGWIASNILTNGELSKNNYDYLNERIYPCNERVEEKLKLECWKIEINSKGLRNDEINTKKLDDVFRIIAVGGSTTFSGETNEKTWPGHLQRIIEENIDNRKIEVINAGIKGGTTNHELDFIKSNLTFLQPDLIIMYDGWNDAISVNVEKTIKNWKEICQISKDKNIATTIIIQPLPLSGQRVLTDQEVQNILNPILSSPREYQKISQQYVDSFSELNETCTQTFDFRGIFDYINAPIYYDGGHILNHGSVILASNIFTSISSEFFDKSFIIKHNFSPNFSEKEMIYAVKINFENKNMSGLFLQNTIFDKSKLTNVDFVNSNLINSRFVFSDLTNANLSGADLTNANLSGADLTNANLSGADLTNANLSGADLTNANLSGANLLGTNLDDSLIDNKWIICKLGFEFLSEIQNLPGNRTLEKFLSTQC